MTCHHPSTAFARELAVRTTGIVAARSRSFCRMAQLAPFEKIKGLVDILLDVDRARATEYRANDVIVLYGVEKNPLNGAQRRNLWFLRVR